jgi:hypothetical protein
VIPDQVHIDLEIGSPAIHVGSAAESIPYRVNNGILCLQCGKSGMGYLRIAQVAGHRKGHVGSEILLPRHTANPFIQVLR